MFPMSWQLLLDRPTLPEARETEMPRTMSRGMLRSKRYRVLCVQALSARGKMHWELSLEFVSNFCESAYDVKKKTDIVLYVPICRISHINVTWIMELCSLKLKLRNLNYVDYPEGITNFFIEFLTSWISSFFLGKHLRQRIAIFAISS